MSILNTRFKRFALYTELRAQKKRPWNSHLIELVIEDLTTFKADMMRVTEFKRGLAYLDHKYLIHL
jgi:hypothetical protein